MERSGADRGPNDDLCVPAEPSSYEEDLAAFSPNFCA